MTGRLSDAEIVAAMTGAPTAEEVEAANRIARQRHAEAVREHPRTFVGLLPSGLPAMVTLYHDGTADFAVKSLGRWGAPVELTEVQP